MSKILIAHDGSDCSEKALRDLRKAGVPEAAEAVVLTVADGWIDQTILFDPSFGVQYAAPLNSGYDPIRFSLEEAENNAKKAAETLKGYFPFWKIEAQSVADSAADGVIDKINSWKPDLVVLGSHGRSAVGRLLFGSVSQKILSHVHCNLRISRGRDENTKQIAPLRLVVAYDGSQESETALETVLCRHWPKGTAVRLITVLDMKVSTAFLQPRGPIRYWTSLEDKIPTAWVDRMLSYQKDRIEEKGLIAYSEALMGDPKRILLKEAEEWGADTIFVGPRGLTGRERIIAGSVSTSLATHAHCSVEIVHCLWNATVCCDHAREQHRECMSREFEYEEKR